MRGLVDLSRCYRLAGGGESQRSQPSPCGGRGCRVVYVAVVRIREAFEIQLPLSAPFESAMLKSLSEMDKSLVSDEIKTPRAGSEREEHVDG